MNLINDVISCIKKDKKDVVYGKAGEVVIVISDCGNVIIVESASGNRFPCKPDDLSTEVLKHEKPILPAKPIINPVQAAPVKRTTPAPLINQQQQLF